jgi:hypothetical protein
MSVGFMWLNGHQGMYFIRSLHERCLSADVVIYVHTFQIHL